MKKWILILFGLYLLAGFAQKQTDGFTFGKLSSHLEGFESIPSGENALASRYKYLAKGGQAYVFVSEDGKTVLKFFRGSKRKKYELLHRIFKTKSTLAKIDKEKADLEEAMKSYLLAQKFLQEETGILSTHFKKTEPIKICIIDKLGIEHTIDANPYPFIVQKRATLVKDHISDMMRKNDPQSAKSALRSLLALIHSREEKGIDDKDPNLSKNFGFIGNQAVQIDAGRFSFAAPNQKKCLKEDLQHWINKHYPELSESFYAMD